MKQVYLFFKTTESVYKRADQVRFGLEEGRGEMVLAYVHNDKERGQRVKAAVCRRRLVRFGLLVFTVAVLSMVLPDQSAAAREMTAAQRGVGTMPLLAALGVGIIIAVGAVVAFLHMTAQGKQADDSTEYNRQERLHSMDEAASDAAYFEDLNDPGRSHIDHQAAAEPATSESSLQDRTILLGQTQIISASPIIREAHGPRLRGVGGEFSGLMFPVTGSGLSIGRDPAYCHIVFPASANEVSRRHCTLRYESDSQLFYLEDHGSSNGTYLSDGRQLQPGKWYPLRSGERFALSGEIHWFAVHDES